ncbi:hypothetical protein PIB30_046590 [Stylosanthes scabra]|uniref:Uncharacterized protein n=1 Tax=Stylosanthes scabra TaxID=79078 RepID=A0ABU6QFW4_9FABA|nr:hypothetical protein [Stylosanthes scabra]
MGMMFSVVLNQLSFAGQMRRWVCNSLKILFCGLLVKITGNEFGNFTTDIRIMLTEPFTLKGDDTDVALIRDWHLHLAVIPLLELYALLTDEGNNSEADSQSGGGWQET